MIGVVSSGMIDSVEVSAATRAVVAHPAPVMPVTSRATVR